MFIFNILKVMTSIAKHLFLTFVLFVSTVLSVDANAVSLRLAVVSDIHIFDTALIKQPGEAFENYLVNDRKMLVESKAIAQEAMKRILEYRPDFLLISGDLTKDGELVGHRYVADSILAPLKKAGIQPIVVPGNHDVNNPHAAVFEGSKKIRTTTVSAGEFAEIYADYGYADAIARDTASLSYVFQLNDSIRVLALDACRYSDNDFDADNCLWQGRLSLPTIQFALDQLRDAEEKNISVIGLMHHGILEHWKYQNTMLPGYVVDDYKDIARRLAKAGLNVVFTGHAHVQDAVGRNWGKHSITDIQTGSTVSFPIPYRTAEVDADSLRIATHLIHSAEGVERADSLVAYSEQMLRSIATSMISGMFPESIDAGVRTDATDMLATFFVRYTLGDEQLTDADRHAIRLMTKRIAKYSFKWSLVFREASKALLSDKSPADNNLSVKL